MRVSIPLPRRCERRTLPIELIPHIYLFKCLTSVYDWLAEWSKALVLGTSLFGGVGSNPTPVTDLWGISSIGRVRRSQRRGTGIETRILHLLLFRVCGAGARGVRSTDPVTIECAPIV